MSKIGTRQEYHDTIGMGIMGKDNCPFCDIQATKNTLIHELKYWKIVHNKYPYSGNEHHLMAVPKRHFAFPCDAKKEEWMELNEVHDFMRDYFEKAWEIDYFSSTRETMWNRSVEHYHMHFIPGKLQWKFLRCMLENQGYPIKAEVEIKK